MAEIEKKDRNYHADLLTYCREQIPGKKADYYDTILATCIHSYMADDGDITRERIIEHVVNALCNNLTSIAAISQINKYDLLQDVYDDNTYYMDLMMNKVLDAYNITLINKADMEKMIENNSLFSSGLYLCKYDQNEIVAIDNQSYEIITESFDSIDEAIAYLEVYEMDYNYEASLINDSNNSFLIDVLEYKGYFDSKEKVLSLSMIDDLYDELTVYDIEELGVTKSDMYDLSLDELNTVADKLETIRIQLIEISNILSKENSKENNNELEFEKE